VHPRAIDLRRGTLASVGVATGLLALVEVPVEQSYPLSLVVPASVVAAGALFGLLSREWRLLRRVAAERLPHLAAKIVLLSLSAASEEVIWRWFLLGGLAGPLGVLPALALTTLAFALAHGWQGHGRFVHLLTGSTFGGIFLVTGSLTGAIAAHATYNLLIAVAVESERSVAPQMTTERTSGELVAELSAVEKSFGEVKALEGVDLVVRRGEVVALLGQNGAGKTTALGILVGLRRPDRGTAALFGLDPRDARARLRLGVTPQEIGFPPTLKVEEIVELVRAHYASPASTSSLLADFGLESRARRQAGGLSGGEKRRLATALAFAGNPDAMVLDEPTTGLDVEARRGLWEAVRAFADAGGTVLLTTHNLAEAEALASRVVVLHRGRVLADGTVPELRARAGVKTIRLQAQDLPELPSGVHVAREGDSLVLQTREADELLRSLVAQGVSLKSLEVLPVSLEDAFLGLTGEET